MTVATIHAVKQYDGNGSITLFTVDFQFIEEEDLLVTIINEVTGAETIKTLATHYTVIGGKDINGQPDVGFVEMLVAPTTDEKIRVERVSGPIQPLPFNLGSDFNPEQVETGLDRSILLDQENKLTVARSLRVSMTNYLAGVSLALPVAVAGKYLRWNATATGLENAGLANRGPWASGTAYVADDFVSNLGSTYICVVAHSSGASTEPGVGGSFDSVWDLAAPKGDIGAPGLDAGIPWNFDSSTSMANPGTANLRLNNAALASVTAMAIHYNSAMVGNPSVNSWVLGWDDSTTPSHKGTLIIRDADAPNNFAVYSINAALTDNSTWAQIPLTHVNSNGTLSGALSVWWVRTGNQGAAGGGSGDMLAANNLSDVANAATAFANIKQAATLTATGVAELATDAEAQAKADTARVLTPSNLAALPASETFAGFVERATDAEAAAGSDTTRYMSPAQLHEDAADVASAGTCNIGAAASNFVRITGTTGITAFDAVAAGVWRMIRFAGALTLTYNATSMILPSVASITTAANDCCFARSLGSGNWIVMWYQKANGQALVSVGGGAPAAAQGRVTLSSATPVMTSSVTAATTVYYTPFLGRHVPLYDGTTFNMADTGGELSQATSDTSKSPAAVTTNSNYDIFVWDDAGTKRATRGPAWSSGTSRGTGAGTTELVRVNGFLLNANSITNGPAAQRGTYVGTIRSNGSSQIDWQFGTVAASGGQALLGVWNMYNRAEVETFVGDNTNTWTYNSATLRSSNNSATNRVSFLQGLAEDSFVADIYWRTNGVSSENGVVGVGYDSTSALASPQRIDRTGITSVACFQNAQFYKADIGWHFAQAIEAATSGTVTFYGDNNLTNHQTGIAYRGRH